MAAHTRRFVIVTRTPRAAEVRRTYASASLARFALKERHESYSTYSAEEEAILEAIERVKAALHDLGHILEIDRSLLPSTPFHGDDIFVAVGQDGLVANTLRYSRELPVIGINPDPARYEGALLPFTPSDASQAARAVLEKSFPIQKITLAEGKFSNGASIIAANDLFIGKADHSSALYRVAQHAKEERQSSSGILVSTPMGATAWQRSILAGARGIIQTFARETVIPDVPPPAKSERSLSFWVREPWPSVASQANIVAGHVTEIAPLTVVSEMGSGGVVFADGMQQDSFPFPAGERLTIKPATISGALVVKSVESARYATPPPLPKVSKRKV